MERRKRNASNPTAGDADLWIEIWEELHNIAAGDTLVEVEHVKAHRTKKEKKEMSHFEKFVTEGNEKADELEFGVPHRRFFLKDLVPFFSLFFLCLFFFFFFCRCLLSVVFWRKSRVF